MGGAAVSKQIAFEGKEYFESWPLTALGAVFERAGDIHGADSTINTARWFEIFNDFVVLLPNGNFASLPTEIFKRFADETKRAKVVQPLLLLTVLADPGYTPKHKATNPAATLATGGAQLGLAELIGMDAEAIEVRLAAIGKLFAQSRIVASHSASSRVGEPAFTKAELCALFAELIEVLRIFGVVSNRVSPEAIANAPQEVVESAWSQIRAVDEQQDSLKRVAIDINAAEEEVVGISKLAEWCKSDLGKRGLLSKCLTGDVLGSVKIAKQGGAFGVVQEKKLDASKSAARHQRARRRYSSSAMDKNNTKEAMATYDKAKKEGKDARLEMRQQQKERADKLNSVATQRAMMELMMTQDIEYKALLDLREAFGQAAHVSEGTREDAFISRTTLADILTSRFPELESGKVLDRALDVFDVDRDGKIVFEEFIVAIARVRPEASVEKQLSFVLSLYDKDQSGSLELWEVMDFIEMHRDDLHQMGAFCKQFSSSLDIDGDGRITLTEFTRSCSRQPLFINYCWGAMPPTHPDISAALESLCEHTKRAAAGGGGADDDDGSLALETPRDEIEGRIAPEAPAMFDVLRVLELYAPPLGLVEKLSSRIDVEDAWKKIESALGLAYSGASEPAGDAGLSARAAVEQMFDVVEREANAGDGHADGERLWSAIAKRCARSLDQKARCLFKIIDGGMDDDLESVNLAEIHFFLDDVALKLDQNLKYAIEKFDDMDENGNGEVSLDELTSFVLRDPQILQLYSLIFYF